MKIALALHLAIRDIVVRHQWTMGPPRLDPTFDTLNARTDGSMTSMSDDNRCLCAVCEGRGWIVWDTTPDRRGTTIPRAIRPGDKEEDERECPACNGSGVEP